MKKIFNKILFTFACLFIITCISLAGYSYFAIKDLTEPEIQRVIEKKYSQIYDSSNRLIESLGENKTQYISYEELPPILINALISVEDNEFFYHDGINFKRIIKSLVNNILSSSTQGGSTITQQLVKNLVLTNEQSLKRKIQEAYLAFIIEQNMTKEQILEFYFNEIYFEGTMPGIAYASKRFFNKEVSLLSLPECALLVGLVKSPTYYNPFNHPDRADERKNIVLYTMRNNNYITEEQYQNAIKKHVSSFLVPKGSQYQESNYQYQAYLDIVYSEVEEITGLNPFSTPLIIETYLDTSLQAYLDDIQKENVFNFIDEEQQIASCVLSNQDASIIGVIGGRNYDGIMLYNRAYNMRRQPASTMKPIFTYALAMEYLDYNEYTPIEDKPYTYKNTNTTVQNADKNYLGTIPLVEALGYSRNTSTLYTLEKVVNKIGQEKCVDYLKQINIMDEGPFAFPYAIGGMKYGVSPIQLAGAYSVFPREGNFLKPSTIKCVKDFTTGKIIYQRDLTGQQVLSKESAYIMNSTLKKMIDGNYYNIGYSKPSNIIMGGKTGTNAYDDSVIRKYNFPSYADRDVWFCGYSKNFTIASWSGFDEPIKDKKTYFGKNDTRRIIVKDIFKNCLKKLELERQDFQVPDDVVSVNIVKNTNDYYLPNEIIPSSYIVPATFKKDKIPTKIMPLPVFETIVDPKIILVDNILTIDLNNELIEDEIYKNIFGDRVYMVTYEDEFHLETYFFETNHFSINTSSLNFKLTIAETYKNNNKITGEPYFFEPSTLSIF